jgi:hypothetical protein
LEDIPEKDRDPSMWEFVSDYAPVYLRLVWEGILDGRDELLAAGVDFTRLEGVDEDDVAAARVRRPRSRPASQAQQKRSLHEEDG